MDSSHVKKIKSVKPDRLSSLPDELIHKILSFIRLKYAIRISVLSSRWRFIWTSMPYLNLSTEEVSSLHKFYKYINNILTRRNSLVQVFSMNLSFSSRISEVCVKEIMEYVNAHNIQQLNLVRYFENRIEFPLSLFSSQSLKHLTLIEKRVYCDELNFPIASSSFELPALTTLLLRNVTLHEINSDKCVGLFSKCVNLKNLTLKDCNTEGLNSLNILHSQLSNLTLEDVCGTVEVVNVVAPRLKNLTIRDLFWVNHHYLISSPDLTSLLYNGYSSLHLSADGFHSLEKVDLCVLHQSYENALRIRSLFQQFHSVKYLTINLEIVELLSSYVEIISVQPAPFANLKSLKIYPAQPHLSEEQEKKRAKMSTQVKNYLLDKSPNATFTMVSREEFRAMKNTKLAQKLIAEVRVYLEKENVKTETNMTQMEKSKTPMESHNTKIHEQIGGTTTQIKSYWKDLSLQIEQRKASACCILPKLESIEGLLTKLPAPNRAIVQPCFSSLCAETDIFMSKITDCMKIQCDKNQNRLTACFHELARAFSPSS